MVQERPHIHRTVFANSLVVLLSTVGIKLAMFCLYVLVLNRMTQEKNAVLGNSFSWGLLVAGVVDYGNRLLLLREAPFLKSNPVEFRRLVGLCYTQRRLTWLIALVVAMPLFSALGYGNEMLAGMAIFFCFGLLDAGSFQAKYTLRGLHQSYYEPMVTAVGRGITIALGLFLVKADILGPIMVACCFVIGSWVEYQLATRVLNRVIDALPSAQSIAASQDEPGVTGSDHISGGWEDVRKLYRRTTSFGAGILCSGLAQRLPYILTPVLPIGKAFSDLTLALLTTAARLPEAASFLPSNVMTTVLPALKPDAPPEERTRRFQQVLEYMTTGAVVAAILLYLETETIVHLLFEPHLWGAAPVLMVLSAWLGALFIERGVGTSLVALKGERHVAIGHFIAMTITFLGCFFLIPSQGAEGAAMALLGGLTAHIVWMLTGFRRHQIRLGIGVINRPFWCGVALILAWWGVSQALPVRLLGVDAIASSRAWVEFFLRSGAAGGAAALAFIAATWPQRKTDFLYRMIQPNKG